MVIKRTKSDVIMTVFIYVVILLILAAILYPLLYTLSMSISEPRAVITGQVTLLPKGLNLAAYQKVLSDPEIYRYYYNTLWYTIVGTVCSVSVTMLLAYPLSRKRFSARKGITIMVMITMFFTAGLIPNYLIVVRMGLYNSRWALILPTLTAAWYVVVCRSFLESLPEELFESARIEGAGEWRILWRIVLPLSKPVIATLVMYFATYQWNSYFPAMVYLKDRALQPMQIYLRQVVIMASVESVDSLSAETVMSMMQTRYVVVIVAILPVLLFYPLLRKYLVKGLLIGAVKG